MTRENLLKMLDSWIPGKKQEFLDDLEKLVSIRSVYSTPAPDKPYGEGCWNVLHEALKISGEYGFKIKNYDNYCGSATLGNSDESIGIFGHLDVVPEGDGWATDPYRIAVKENNYIFGRGTADNKAPALVALYAMRFLKEHDIPLNHSVMMVFGCDEERGMSDIPQFLAREKAPVFSLVPDAKYPLGHAEKGIIEFSMTQSHMPASPIMEMHGGIASNSVPDHAFAIIDKRMVDAEAISVYVNTDPRLSLEMSMDSLKLESTGDLRHASRPQNAVNAIEHLLSSILAMKILSGEALDTFKYLQQFILDYSGKFVKIACSDDISGSLTLVGSIIHLKNQELSLSVNIRYPVKADNHHIISQLYSELTKQGFAIENFSDNQPLFVPLEHPAIDRLVDITSDLLQMDDLEPLVLEGGTYARKLPNAVSFGVTVPGRIRLFGMEKGGAHQVDEYGDLKHLLLGIKIYATALYELDQIL